ncbi:hypothetical protein TRICI_003036 [Trichomonascus ciferrii]|uniref:Mitotic checkpoint regulator, MAD2B-interacting-domain-containing protein n=1 Tax=Trichomonascus ciferrii TaxID=44093 RepID=A0A642V4Z8_9ASCO|nr:hypothetical protein TRICI_003036 [Trichomonascus ciferrii]
MGGLVDYSSESSGSDDEKDTQKQVGSKGLNLPPPKRSGGGLDLPAPKNRKKTGPRTIVLEKEKKDVEDTRQDAAKDSEPVKSGGGIGSFLPAPKGRIAKREIPGSAQEDKEDSSRSSSSSISAPVSRQNRVLGGGLKPTFDGEVAMDAEQPRLPVAVPVAVKERKMVPASVLARRAKYGDSAPSPKKPQQSESAPRPDSDDHKPKKAMPNLFSFGSQAASTGPAEPMESNKEYEPIMLEKEQRADTNEQEITGSERKPDASGGLQALAADSGISVKDIERLEGRRRRTMKDEPVNVVDFSVDEFYQTNEDLRQKGLLEESKRPIQAVGSGRHQLRSLVESAQQNREGLEDMFTKNRRTKAEAGSKYGF